MEQPLQMRISHDNFIRIQFASKSENEGVARVAVAAFVSQLDPTVEQLTELKTAVSEAVTNAIIHGYDGSEGEIRLECKISQGVVDLLIEDDGIGIDDIEEASQPLYTSKPDLERSGMGITIMENFVDELMIESTAGRGTRVHMRKVIHAAPANQ